VPDQPAVMVVTSCHFLYVVDTVVPRCERLVPRLRLDIDQYVNQFPCIYCRFWLS